MVYDVLKVGKFKECFSLSKGNVPNDCLINYVECSGSIDMYTGCGRNSTHLLSADG